MSLSNVKRSQVRPCDCCGEPHLVGLFAVVNVQSAVLDGRAVQRQAGLEMFFGGGPQAPALASIMGPDADNLGTLRSMGEVVMCMECYAKHPIADVLLRKPVGAEANK